MNIKQERADFEAFASKHGLCVTEEGDLYRSHVVAWMWKAWQARAAIEPVKVPSDAEIGQILKEVLHNSPYGVHQWELWLEFASALFTRYGQEQR